MKMITNEIKYNMHGSLTYKKYGVKISKTMYIFIFISNVNS